MESILSLYQFTGQQADAVHAPDEALVVTAGAGSGKTRTLVGRYLALLESGLPLRSIVAITFTAKAAREMRARIRTAIETWLERCPELVEGRCDDTADRWRWEVAFAALDGARIGTIHSLCAEILRAHPAEARLDPDFDVLDGNQAALLKARAVESAMAWAATAPDVVPLFELMTEYQLRQALATLVEKRLDVVTAFDAGGSTELAKVSLARWSDALAAWLHERLERPAWADSLDDLTRLQAHQPDDKLEVARRDVLARWDEARAALESCDWETLFAALLALRSAISTGGAKKNWDAGDLAAARGAMKSLRAHFDADLAPLLKKRPVSWTLDERNADALPRLRRLFDRALAEYDRLKDDRRALDFDDLEAGALALLTNDDDVRARWQSEVRAVLVDEFQDTNNRQQRIVYALSGFAKSPISNLQSPIPNPKSQAGALFVVGDSKQSIYRFRGADVTVFRRVQADVADAGGRHVPLDLTFRAHAALVALVNDLLAPVLGEQDDPDRPYAVPFAPLSAHREEPRPGVCAPYVELHLGLGENAEEGRAAAATALAHRLHRLHEEERVEWGEMALLFRASTGFPSYEDALERAGIPFVTVAGRGFYDRPEVRDLLNALAALADPTDDLALAGLLRSPAFALSDVALYLLRWGWRQGDKETGGQGDKETGGLGGQAIVSPCPLVSESPCPLWDALDGPLEHLDPPDATRAHRAREVIAELCGLAGRVTVGNLLGRLLDAVHYRAALYLAGGHRLCRNVDKLLADAHRSGMVSVGEFLEYVQSLRDVAAREGEAPVEAGGAVQLMTVHKAKGLEFPVVVVADATHAGGGRVPSVLISPDLGVLPGLREEKTMPATYRLASLHDADQEDAESRRLLYVAATRAQEKLVVSGHIKAKKDGTPELRGWLAWLGEVAGLNQAQLPNPLTIPQPLDLGWEGGELACVLYPLSGRKEEPAAEAVSLSPPHLVSLSPPLPGLIAPLAFVVSAGTDLKTQERESEPPPRVWRVVPVAQKPAGPAWVVGSLVHTALRHWRFPDRPGLEDFVRPFALEAGLTDPEEIRRTIAEARRLLARFQADPLYIELDRAERRHELPYAVEVGGVPRSGIVDLLARLDEGWTVVEFKTDRLKGRADVKACIRKEKYDEQVRGYVTALGHILGERPSALLVFLNVGRKVEVAELDSASEYSKIQLLNSNS